MHAEEKLGILIEEGLKIRLGNALEHGIIGEGDRRGRARGGIQQAHLAEVLAGTQLGQLRLVGAAAVEHNGDSAAAHGVHAVGRIALAEDHIIPAEAYLFHKANTLLLKKAPGRYFRCRVRFSSYAEGDAKSVTTWRNQKVFGRRHWAIVPTASMSMG